MLSTTHFAAEHVAHEYQAAKQVAVVRHSRGRRGSVRLRVRQDTQHVHQDAGLRLLLHVLYGAAVQTCNDGTKGNPAVWIGCSAQAPRPEAHCPWIIHVSSMNRSRIFLTCAPLLFVHVHALRWVQDVLGVTLVTRLTYNSYDDAVQATSTPRTAGERGTRRHNASRK